MSDRIQNTDSVSQAQRISMHQKHVDMLRQREHDANLERQSKCSHTFKTEYSSGPRDNGDYYNSVCSTCGYRR